MWFNRRIRDFIEIGINSQPNLDVALEKYRMGNHILFLASVSTHADPEGDGLSVCLVAGSIGMGWDHPDFKDENIG
jgi:hypothetical protein